MTPHFASVTKCELEDDRMFGERVGRPSRRTYAKHLLAVFERELPICWIKRNGRRFNGFLIPWDSHLEFDHKLLVCCTYDQYETMLVDDV